MKKFNDIKAKFSFKNLRINDTSIGNVYGELIYDGNSLDLFNLSSKYFSCRAKLKFISSNIQGNVKILKLTLGKKKTNKGSLDFLFRGGKLLIKKMLITSLKGDSSFELMDGSYLSFKDRQFLFLSKLYGLHYPPIVISGKFRASGKWGGGNIVGRIFFDDFWLNQLGAKNFRLNFVLNKELLKISSERVVGNINFKRKKLITANMDINRGSLKLVGKFSNKFAKLDLSGREINLQDIISIFGLKIIASGSSNFHILLKKKGSRNWISGSLKVEGFCIRDFKLGRLVCEMPPKANYLKVSKFELKEKNKIDISGNGVMPLFFKNKPISINLSVKKIDLSLLTQMLPQIKDIQGNVVASISFSGDVENPHMDGFVKLTCDKLEFRSYLPEIKKIRGEVDIKGQEVRIKELNGETVHGVPIRVTGFVKFENYKPKSYWLELLRPEKPVRILIPELELPSGLLSSARPTWAEIRPSLVLTNSGGKPNLLLDVDIRDAHFNYPPKRGSFTGEFLKPLDYTLSLNFGKNVWYEGENANLAMVGKLKIVKEGERIRVDGVLESRRGTIDYLGETFQVKYLCFEVKENVRYLEAVAEKFVETSEGEDVIQLVIEKSPYDKIAPKFFSRRRKDLKSEELIEEVFGIGEEMSPSDKRRYIKQQFVKLFDSIFTSNIAKSILQRKRIVDGVRITRVKSISSEDSISFSLFELLEGTKYTFEKYLSDDFFIGYSLVLGNLQRKLELRHQLELAYRLKGNIFIRGVYEIGDESSRGERKILIEPVWKFKW